MSDELHELAASLGVDLAPPTTYQLADEGRRVLTSNGHHRHCPLECDDPHDGPDGQPGSGSSCPWRRVPIDVALPDVHLRDLKLRGAL